MGKISGCLPNFQTFYTIFSKSGQISSKESFQMKRFKSFDCPDMNAAEELIHRGVQSPSVRQWLLYELRLFSNKARDALKT